MGFASDDLDDGQREFLAELSEDQAGAAISILMDRFGYVGTYFQRGDAESLADRPLTDEEWAKVQSSYFWYRAIPDVMSRYAWDTAYEALRDVGIPIGGDDPDEDDSAEDGAE